MKIWSFGSMIMTERENVSGENSDLISFFFTTNPSHYYILCVMVQLMHLYVIKH
jgi:hypothetical protein